MLGATVKPPGGNLKPLAEGIVQSWPITTRFIPNVKGLAVFKEAGMQLFIIFGAETFPSNEELIAATTRARINDTFDFVFL
jgi:hypothetical protein